MPLGNAGAMKNPLGANMPLPGGEPVDTPEPRRTAPGGAPGGLGNQPAMPPTAGGMSNSPMSFDGSRQALQQQHSRNKAWYEQTSKALTKLDVIRKGLGRLADKQDMVTMEDIIDEAGKLVAHGIDPMALAGLLADAPQEGGGEALGGWIAGHAMTAMQGEMQMKQQNDLARHQMGSTAIHLLRASHNATAMLGGMPQQQDNSGSGLSLGGNGNPPSPSPQEPDPNVGNDLGGSM